MRRFQIIFIICLAVLVTACNKQLEKTKVIKLVTNPWPGYEYLHLAESQGYYEEVGLNLRLIALGSLADAQRAYIQGHSDGLTSTIVEAVQAQSLGGEPLSVVLIPDYSNGGDVIVASDTVKNMKDLKGKVIGAEVSSLGIYVLQRALVKNSLTLEDVKIINVEQSNGLNMMKKGEIDAFVTYAPYSIDILKIDGNHTIFSSAEIPYEVIDTVSFSKKILAQNPDLVPKLRKAWQMALEFATRHPQQAIAIMAEREGMAPEEFEAVLQEVQVLTLEQQQAFSIEHDLEQAAKDVCQTLVYVNAIEQDCSKLPNIFYNH